MNTSKERTVMSPPLMPPKSYSLKSSDDEAALSPSTTTAVPSLMPPKENSIPRHSIRLMDWRNPTEGIDRINLEHHYRRLKGRLCQEPLSALPPSQLMMPQRLHVSRRKGRVLTPPTQKFILFTRIKVIRMISWIRRWWL